MPPQTHWRTPHPPLPYQLTCAVHDPQAKGSTRFEKHKAQSTGDQEYAAGEGPQVDRAPGDENISDEAAMDKVENKVET